MFHAYSSEWVAGGVVRYILIPAIHGDFLTADLEMIEGTTDTHTLEPHRKILDAISELEEEYRAIG